VLLDILGIPSLPSLLKERAWAQLTTVTVKAVKVRQGLKTDERVRERESDETERKFLLQIKEE